MGNWHLLKPDGTRYGPTDFKTLKAWAEDGRIEPSDRLSDNDTHWQMVTEVPDLEMHYSVTLADDSVYGPIHARFLASLLRDQAIAGDASVLRVTDDYRASAMAQVITYFSELPAMARPDPELAKAQIRLEEASKRVLFLAGQLDQTKRLLADAAAERDRVADQARQAHSLAEQSARRAEELTVQLEGKNLQVEEWMALQSQLQLHADEVQGLRDPIADREKTMAALPHQRSEAEEQRGTFLSFNPLESELAKWKNLYAEEDETHRQEKIALHDQLRHLQSELKDALAERERDARRITQLERSLKALEEIRTPDEESAGRATEGALQESLVALADTYELLLKQLEEKNALVAELKQERDEIEERAASKAQQIEDSARRDRRELASAQNRLQELEEAHMTLVRSFRDLNDRFIRLRQSIPSDHAN